MSASIALILAFKMMNYMSLKLTSGIVILIYAYNKIHNNPVIVRFENCRVLTI